jgi:hypothetical protein
MIKQEIVDLFDFKNDELMNSHLTRLLTILSIIKSNERDPATKRENIEEWQSLPSCNWFDFCFVLCELLSIVGFQFAVVALLCFVAKHDAALCELWGSINTI